MCSGGPSKRTCGNTVTDDDLGLECDSCHEWYHAACQGIPKAAVKALEKFIGYLSWLCAKCKSSLISGKERPPLLAPLEGKVAELEKVIHRHMEVVESSIQIQEQTMKEHAIQVERTLQSYGKNAIEHAKAVEQSVKQHKATYAEAVKGTCSEVTNIVKAQLAGIPKVSQSNDTKTVQDLSKVLDDHMDKERRKANLVIHNLPEQEGTSVSERSAKDMSSVSTMVKDIMRIHVTLSKSFRVGKRMPEKHRLLIVTLENPASKHDILKGARQLRHSDMYSNVYITPDLTQKEREAGRKLREELAS